MITIIEKEKYYNNVLQQEPTCLVIMSAYNGEQYIKAQVESILNQVGVNVSLLVRNDGSGDNTYDILEKLSNYYQNRIYIINGENVGIHRSFKILFDYAKRLNDFDYLSFSDQDDVWDQDKLYVAINSLCFCDADFYSCSSRLVDEFLKPIGRTTANIQKYRFYMEGNSKVLSFGSQGCSIVITRRLYDFIQSHELPDKYGHDTWIPIVSYYLFNCIYDSNPHISYRQHNNSWTGNRENKVKQFLTESKYYFKGLSRYRPLAKDILKTFDNELKNSDKVILNAISGENRTLVERVTALLKYRFGKYGWKENIVYMLFYLSGL